MARIKQIKPNTRKSERDILRQTGEWKEWRKRHPIEDITKLSPSEVSAKFASMGYTPELSAATTLLQLSEGNGSMVSAGEQRPRRQTKKPKRFQDESFAKNDTYDRSHGGYKWVSKYKDTNTRLPQRHYRELREEDRLVRDIEKEENHGETKEGYQKDGFIVDSSESDESDDY